MNYKKITFEKLLEVLIGSIYIYICVRGCTTHFLENLTHLDYGNYGALEIIKSPILWIIFMFLGVTSIRINNVLHKYGICILICFIITTIYINIDCGNFLFNHLEPALLDFGVLYFTHKPILKGTVLITKSKEVMVIILPILIKFVSISPLILLLGTN
jgi:uncharacterized membrane protein YwzB